MNNKKIGKIILMLILIIMLLVNSVLGLSYWKDTCKENTFWVKVNVSSNSNLVLNITNALEDNSNGFKVFYWFEDWDSYTKVSDLNDNGWSMYGSESNWQDKTKLNNGILSFKSNNANTYGCDIGFEKKFPEVYSGVFTECRKQNDAVKATALRSFDSAAQQKYSGYDKTYKSQVLNNGIFQNAMTIINKKKYGSSTNSLNINTNEQYYRTSVHFNGGKNVYWYFNETLLSNVTDIGSENNFSIRYYSICAPSYNDHIYSDYMYLRKYQDKEPDVEYIEKDQYYSVVINNENDKDLIDYQIELTNIPYDNIDINKKLNSGLINNSNNCECNCTAVKINLINDIILYLNNLLEE